MIIKHLSKYSQLFLIASFIFLFLTTIVLFGLIIQKSSAKAPTRTQQTTFWQFQAVDTMKYSRDLSREKMADPSFDAVINQQTEAIAKTGATHIAIATPYDPEFLPMLKRWVAAARKYHLHVWFRGNFSGWEKWFEYQPINRQNHIQKTKDFIENNSSLFEDGDVFTACPECENGGPGDPRETKDVNSYRQFLIDEYKTTQGAFSHINKSVTTNYISMNADVARLIMDPETTNALGGVVTIDHYVASPSQFVNDVEDIAKKSGGKVVIGEFGAPIPNLQGSMTDDEQAKWVESILLSLEKTNSVIGISYWTNVGGSTQLWDEEGNSRKAVDSITKFYKPSLLTGVILDSYKKPLSNVMVQNSQRQTYTDAAGTFALPLAKLPETIIVNKDGYLSKKIDIDAYSPIDIVLEVNPLSKKTNILDRIKDFFSHFILTFSL